ncbi:MAG TPA: VPLPA-CTERM sorting domain-containing protein [Steroidobacteraceae bacterium]|jgi:hypothetical protein|nr:VPLPA-CTERM sorting domain-containing protein [Steroidobacteraceae bacterium]
MKTVIKLALGGAVLAASVSHAATTLPSTGASSLFFFVNDATAHSTYTIQLTQGIGSGAGSYFNSAQANSGGTPGTINTLFGDANFSYNFAADTTLQNFISAGVAAGDILQWGVQGGAYQGATPVARTPIGNALLLVSAATPSTTLFGSTAAFGGVNTSMNTDVKALNLKTLDAFNGTAAGIFGTAASAGGTNLNLYGNGVVVGSAIGSSAGLFGITSNGTSSGTALSYNIGTASFNGTVFSFTGNTQSSAVPLPAAAWLLGSGLLGLFGIGRRRTPVATV